MQPFSRSASLPACIVIVLALALPGCQSSQPESAVGPVQPTNQTRFKTDQEAAAALISACETNNRDALLALAGKEYRDLVDTGDEAAERATRSDFAALAKEKLVLQKKSDTVTEILVGNTQWPFPIPLVRESDSWRFDTAAGAEEMVARRIGRNELVAIDVCRAYVAAQAEYSRLDRMSDGLLQYAQKFRSSPGRRDGLYWTVEAGSGELSSPLGEFVAAAGDYLEGREEGDPFVGYHFRHPVAAGRECSRRAIQLHHQWPDDRGICDGGVSGRIRQERHQDLRRQPTRRGVRKRPRQRHREDCGTDEGVQPRQDVEGIAVSERDRRGRTNANVSRLFFRERQL